jgi:hypothetical protein
MLSTPSSEQAQELISSHSDTHPVMIQHLKTGADFTNKHSIPEGGMERATDNTDAPPSQKNIQREPACLHTYLCSGPVVIVLLL